jgi:hypothetical protein
MQSVTINEFSQFLYERFYAMMFFLICDVSRHQVHIGMRYRERSIASAPSKFPRNQLTSIYPVGRTSLQELHHLFDRKPSRKIDQRVYMIRVYEIDFHVHIVLVSIFQQIS